MAGPREIRLAGVLDALFAATDKEVGRLRTIVERDQIPHEERFQALVDLARLSAWFRYWRTARTKWDHSRDNCSNCGRYFPKSDKRRIEASIQARQGARGLRPPPRLHRRPTRLKTDGRLEAVCLYLPSPVTGNSAKKHSRYSARIEAALNGTPTDVRVADGRLAFRKSEGNGSPSSIGLRSCIYPE